MTGTDAKGSASARRVATVILGALLVLLLIGVLAAERNDWPSFVGDEATYLMAAESLAWDFDLHYERRDFDRFVELHGTTPEGLILQSGDHGASMTFSKPFFYPAYLAPFVRLAPNRGPLVANVLILAVACALAARTLRRWVGEWSALWVAVFVFSSASFVYAFWVHADLFLMALTAISMSLVFLDPEGRPRRSGLVKWLVGGVLLGAVAFSRPFYLPLLVPAAFCAPRPRRPRLAAYVGGVALLVTISLAIHQGLGDSWTSYDGQRASFSDRTGYPDVDFERGEWDAFIHRWGDFAWNPAALAPATSISPRTWLWNGLYFAVGRHVGVLVYFLPLVLGLVAGPKDHPRWALAAAIAAAIAGAFLLRPHNFFGGGASIANRFFLPIYPAFWLLAGGPLKLRWLLGATFASALFLWPVWSSPGGYVIRSDGTYRFVSPVAAAVLPVETTQSHIKPAGENDYFGDDGLWARPLSPAISSGAGELSLPIGEAGSLLVGRAGPAAEIELVLLSPRPLTLETNAEVIARDEKDGEQIYRLRLGGRRATHRMWWSGGDVRLHRLELRFDSPADAPAVPFLLRWADSG